MRQYKGRMKGFDKWLFILVCLLSVAGIFAIYSATYSYGSLSNVITQSGAFLLGLIIMLLLTFFDYEQYEGMIKYIGAAAVLLLIAVLIVGQTGDWGAKSWIRIGPVGIQPAEFAKVAFIVTFAYHLDAVHDDINKPLTILGLIVHLGVPVGLILLQPDAGSAMVFVFIFIVMIFVGGISYKYIIPVGVAGIASLPLIYRFLLDDFQKARIKVFLNPESDPLYRGYNVIQSKLAVGSGRFFGCGYLKGTQTQMEFLPTKHTDFIFSVICEEFGLFGATVIILLLLLLILRCITTAKNSNSRFGKYIAVGVAAMFIFHVAENCGMCLGLTPVTGIPLPFISYGGTSLITYMGAVGIVMSIAYRRRK